MTENFLKFKNKLQAVRALKSLLTGAAAGGLFGGLALLLSKLAIAPFEPIIALPIGLGVGIVAGIILYLLLRTSDKKLAETLDEEFSLQEKVQTMIAYQDQQGEMLTLQRHDADQTLATVPLKAFKAKRLWAYLIALCVGVTSLASGFIVENKRSQNDPVPPFQITQMQIAGIEELIEYVDDSQMEEVYRQRISASLSELLNDLKAASTEPEMQIALVESMAQLQSTTYDSSSATEILNALWNTKDSYLQGLAKTLDTSKWTTPDWGDFAEKIVEYKTSFTPKIAEGETPPTEETLYQELKWALESFALHVDVALNESKIPETDALYSLVYRIANTNELTPDDQKVFGFGVIASKSALFTTHALMLAQVEKTINALTEEFYAVISQLKINANVGEYAMTKLATLFPVPLPEFERPTFLTTGGGSAGNDSNNNGPSDGGIGEGATYGSDDLVLDPLTGEYVEYGTLIDKYYAVMYEKLENGTYTEEQKEMIKNYFSLLYSGIEKEE